MQKVIQVKGKNYTVFCFGCANLWSAMTFLGPRTPIAVRSEYATPKAAIAALEQKLLEL